MRTRAVAARQMFEQERLILHVQEAISEALERSGLSRTQMSKLAGKREGFVKSALSSGTGLTVMDAAALLCAGGFRLEVRAVPLENWED